MNYIFGDRRSGKTQKIIELAEASNAYIIVPNRAMALSVRDQAEKTGHHILFPVTLHEVMHRKNTGFVTDCFIDNADILLEDIFRQQGWTIQGVSMNVGWGVLQILSNGIVLQKHVTEPDREQLVSWLSKFCRHIDMGDKLYTDEEALKFFKEKMNHQFGWEFKD